MKTVAIFLISFYQYGISPFLHSIGVGFGCRYSPTCSTYAKQAILKKGVIIGGYLAIRRILSCQPFAQKPYGKSL